MSVNLEWKNYVASTGEWLDEDALERIRAALPAIADAVVTAIQQEVAGYRRPLRGEFGRSVKTGTEIALRRFIGDDDGAESDDVYRRLGGGEYRAGRSLDALQAAYRVGARVAWRQMSDAAAGAGASERAQRNLAEAMFAYIDRLAGESVEGYAAAQLRDAGDRDRHRSELAEMLLAGAGVAEAELVRAAEAARWPLPRNVACVAVAGEQAGRARLRVSGDALGVSVGEVAGIVVPDPVELRRETKLLAERLGVAVGIGPTVALAAAHVSMRLARRALSLASPGGTPVLAEERLAEIALHAEPEILAALRERLLAPLQAQTDASRARLQETLLQWLRHRGAQGAIAQELGVHPQTVRYRMARLRELLGDLLEDPEQRFALEMALRGEASAPPRAAAG
jgi:hypothetical protein